MEKVVTDTMSANQSLRNNIVKDNRDLPTADGELTNLLGLEWRYLLFWGFIRHTHPLLIFTRMEG